MIGFQCSKLLNGVHFRRRNQHFPQAFWHLRRTFEDRRQWGTSFLHFLFGQILAHPEPQVAQHCFIQKAVPQRPFILIARHCRFERKFQHDSIIYTEIQYMMYVRCLRT